MDKYLISAKIAIFLQITTFTLSNDVNLFFSERYARLFLEDEEYRENQTYESDDMIPSQSFVLHYEQDDDRENHERYGFLYDFEFPYRERTSELLAADAVRRNHDAVFGERDEPTDDDDGEKSQTRHALLEQYLPVPGERHEYVGTGE